MNVPFTLIKHNNTSMSLRSFIFFAISLLFIRTDLSAQLNKKKFKISDLSKSIGKWNGTLTYLDYTSGKPYTMRADIMISFTTNKLGYIISYNYPNEPNANSKDTTYANGGGKYFGKEKVVSFNKSKSGEFTLITEFEDIDGNDKKEALIKHIYRLEGNSFSIRKDVKFKGTTNWLNRHEYLFNKYHKVIITSF